MQRQSDELAASMMDVASPNWTRASLGICIDLPNARHRLPGNFGFRGAFVCSRYGMERAVESGYCTVAERGVWASFWHPNPQRSPFMTPKFNWTRASLGISIDLPNARHRLPGNFGFRGAFVCSRYGMERAVESGYFTVANRAFGHLFGTQTLRGHPS